MKFNNDDKVTRYVWEASVDTSDLPDFAITSRYSGDHEFDSGIRWVSVLYEFTKFLSSIYGYDVTEKVTVDGMSISNAVTAHALEVGEFKKNYMMGTADDWKDDDWDDSDWPEE